MHAEKLLRESNAHHVTRKIAERYEIAQPIRDNGATATRHCSPTGLGSRLAYQTGSIGRLFLRHESRYPTKASSRVTWSDREPQGIIQMNRTNNAADPSLAPAETLNGITWTLVYVYVYVRACMRA